MGFEIGCQWCVIGCKSLCPRRESFQASMGLYVPLAPSHLLKPQHSFSLSIDHDRPRRDSSYKAPDEGHPAPV